MSDPSPISWSLTTQTLGSGRLKYRLTESAAPLTFRQFIHHLQHTEPFRAFFNATLAAAPHKAFRWETPALRNTNLDQPFEYVLLSTPTLERKPDPRAFANHFRKPGADPLVATFENLAGDALMIAPGPGSSPGASNDLSCYTHLAAFVRHAPPAQQDRFWQAVGQAVHKNLDNLKPLWLSASGLGVAWLHIRIDEKPKYYGHTPYKSI